MTYETFDRQCAQGDMLITKIDKLPNDIQIQPMTPEEGYHILAHSETGHHHIITDNQVEFYSHANDNFVAYLVVNNPEGALIEHKRSFDTHAPIKVNKGIYEIRRQREYINEGFRAVAD